MTNTFYERQQQIDRLAGRAKTPDEVEAVEALAALNARVKALESALADYMSAWPSDVPAGDGAAFMRAQATMDTLGIRRIFTVAEAEEDDGDDGAL